MNIILVGKIKGKPVRFQVGGDRLQVGLFGSVLASVMAGLVYLGVQIGISSGHTEQLVTLEEKVVAQKELIAKARFKARTDMDALIARIGLMQADVTRLNALGQRLIAVSDIDAEEFDFSRAPAVGGPHDEASTAAVDFENILGVLNEQLASREQQLSVLEDVIISQRLKSETKPTGRPAKKGWISSYFGERADPFTGKLEMHKGIDFAAKEGTGIIAVADGIVTWSGKRYGYGNLVEVNHGNGYVTRYGHNKEMLVQVGDNVKRGQTISLMGSSGRSTGPHVHFEVLKNDRHIDPIRYVQSRS